MRLYRNPKNRFYFLSHLCATTANLLYFASFPSTYLPQRTHFWQWNVINFIFPLHNTDAISFEIKIISQNIFMINITLLLNLKKKCRSRKILFFYQDVASWSEVVLAFFLSLPQPQQQQNRKHKFFTNCFTPILQFNQKVKKKMCAHARIQQRKLNHE